MKFTLVISFFITLSLNAFAQTQYTGVMEKSGSRPLGIEMVIEDTSNERNIRAYYYYTSQNIRIDLIGMLNGNILTLHENTTNSQAVFLFRNFNINSSNITGTWQNSSDIYTVTLNRSSLSPSTSTGGTATIGNAIIDVYQGSISETGQQVTYEFTPPRSGWYRFEMSGLTNADVNLALLNNSGTALENTSSGRGNGEGITHNLTGGQTYWIRIRQYRGFSSYRFIIGQQKETVDISSLNSISDSIQFTDQRNIYSFIPSRDGWYRFELAGLTNADVNLEILNFSGVIENTSSGRGNGQGLTRNLTGGQTYWIRVRYYRGFSSYRLIIGQQKETVDISRLNSISDSIQFTDQRNIYSFIPSRDGSYQFLLEELNNADVNLEILNFSGVIGNTSSGRGNGQGLTQNLTGGQTYWIRVRHYRGFSSYKLNIIRP